MGYYRDMTKNCIHGNLPDCAGLCPFRFDVRDFTEKLIRGRFDAAYRVYRDTVLFPEIVSRLCSAACRGGCCRKETDAPVRRNLLELAAVQFARQKAPVRLNVPDKGKSVVIIGAGPGGLACALRLASRKYRVTVFDQRESIGGSLLDLPEREIFLADIENQFGQEKWEFKGGTKITGLSRMEADAVYIATGQGGEDFGALEGRRGYFTSADGVFIGGSILGGDAVSAIRDGRDAAERIEGYLKTGRMEDDVPPLPVGNRPDPVKLVYLPAVEPEAGGLYTQAQALAEAGRCLRCDCDICQRKCPLMAFYRRYPDKIAEMTEGTVWATDLFYHHLATRMLASCDQCGVCGEVCPRNVDVKALILDARRVMVKKGEMPKVFSAFWLEDMAHANGETAMIVKGAEDNGERGYVFFPGCQLGASDPRYVTLAYERLKRTKPTVGLLAACCGAPAYWAGDEALHAEVLDRLREVWRRLGEPVLICACATCGKMLAETLPEIKTVSLYQMEWDAAPAGEGLAVSIFDPCSSRFDPETQRSVRRLAAAAGCALSPDPPESADAVCCGWGGQYEIANPAMARAVTGGRQADPETVYVTYCANCRDTFARAGKPVLHILDILLGLGDARRLPPTWTRRRANRESLCRE
ncbi:MAG: NAD(P)-binding protein, partial [Peptococcaceae bacterium]|nr:NAD(P)-binding protein [Peptococcaceae bacterium]